MLDYWENNDLCEICYANDEPDYSYCTIDIYWVNTHCIELRKNRKARENKNIKPMCTVF